MTPPERSSLLKSSADRFFSFTRDNFQAFAIHPHSLGNSDSLTKGEARYRKSKGGHYFVSQKKAAEAGFRI